MSLQIAFSRPTGTTEERDLLFRQYRSAGYDGLQLKYGQYAPYIADPARFLEEWGDLPGVGSALIAGGTLDEANREAIRALFAFGERIGTQIVVFCHGISRKSVTADDIRTYAGILTELGKEAKQRGMSLSLHHHFDQPVMYREDFDLFFEHVKDETVGLTVDTAHLVKSGISDIAEIITSFSSVIDNFHMKDFADGDWKVLGDGRIDFGPVFQAIGKIGYQGWISADEESGGDVIGGMETCFSFLKRGLTKTTEYETRG